MGRIDAPDAAPIAAADRARTAVEPSVSMAEVIAAAGEVEGAGDRGRAGVGAFVHCEVAGREPAGREEADRQTADRPEETHASV